MTAHILRPVPIPRIPRAALSWRRLWHALLRRVTGLGAGIFSARLCAGQELQLHEVAGWTVVCRSGAVWLTQEGDTRDIFLQAGQGFALDRDGLALVCACRDALLSIRAPVRAQDTGGFRREGWHDGEGDRAVENEAPLAWVRSLYPECGPWNDPASYRRAGLL